MLLNAPLPKDLKPTLNPKLPTAVIMVLFSTVEGKGESGLQMFKCESKEKRQELLDALDS